MTVNGILVDSCVLLDLFTNDQDWADWSEGQLSRLSKVNTLFINPIIYTEVSVGFNRIEEVEAVVSEMKLRVIELPREALFLAGKTFLQYRKNRGSKKSPLPDFFIGAHASVSCLKVITRDISKFKTYFPKVELVTP
jgi:predicted nucleic acid-binding protein